MHFNRNHGNQHGGREVRRMNPKTCQQYPS